jgi:hypothetical protein
MRVQDVDTFCPMCGGTMDSYGDHALTCPCKGDRTIRHNRLRDIVYEDASKGNMSPERGKAGLLPGRPQADDMPDSTSNEQTNDGVSYVPRSRRRPADVYIPRSIGGSPVALDFACTSGLRSDSLRAAESDPDSILAVYEQFKRDFTATGETETTDAACTRQGFAFVPMVIEAHSGGWSKRARQTLDSIAKHVSASWYTEGEAASLSIAQRLSISLHRENARAVLRRLQETAPDMVPSGWSPDDTTPLW